MERRGARRRVVLVVAAAAAVAGVVAAPAASATGRTQIQIQDRCDPATFNAAFGTPDNPIVCFRTPPRGTVTATEFLAKLNPQDGGHPAWRFTRTDTHIDRGDALQITNAGGEIHSFTEVSKFGAGIVPPLNDALPPGTDPAVPVANKDPNFLPPGAPVDVTGLKPGPHMFQCLIHPWMRSVVYVRG